MPVHIPYRQMCPHFHILHKCSIVLTLAILVLDILDLEIGLSFKRSCSISFLRDAIWSVCLLAWSDD